jgi:hypothetical protein
MFITVFTTARHWSLSWAKWNKSTPSCPISLRTILILSSTPRSSKWSLPFWFPNQNYNKPSTIKKAKVWNGLYSHNETAPIIHFSHLQIQHVEHINRVSVFYAERGATQVEIKFVGQILLQTFHTPSLRLSVKWNMRAKWHSLTVMGSF